ncbi:hypothetical protein ACFL6I_02615 [candidate division KSB1 bacterium]
MKTIFNLPIEEYILRVPAPQDWPTQIVLENIGDYSFEGTIHMAHAGELQIENTREENTFIAYFDEVINGVEFIFFSSLVITPGQMSGIYELAGPALDAAPIPFIAEKKP